jgi:hypothetical protein
MPAIGMEQLQGWARTPDAELRGVRGADGPVVETREGSWGGRVMRNLKIATGEDRAEKREAYAAAKQSVLQALREQYGPEIADKAFRAGVGRSLGDDRWQTSVDHPLTGRHIARMLRTAERELARNQDVAQWRFGAPGEGERAPGLVRLGPTVSTASSPVPAGEAYAGLGRDLDREIAGWLEGQPRDPAFWVLDLALDPPPRGDDRVRIGIGVHPDDPGTLQIRIQGEDVTVPRQELPRWLGEQLPARFHDGGFGGVGVKSMQLHRGSEDVRPSERWERPLADWIGGVRGVPEGQRGSTLRQRELATFGPGENPHARICSALRDDIKFQHKDKEGLRYEHDLYSIEIERRGEIGTPLRFAIHVDHDADGKRGDPSGIPLEIRDQDGNLSQVQPEALEAWLAERCPDAEIRSVTLLKESPSAPLDEARRRLEEPPFDRTNRAELPERQRNDVAVIAKAVAQVDGVVKATLTEDGDPEEIALTIGNLRTLLRTEEEQWMQPDPERDERWADDPRFDAIRGALLEAIGEQLGQLDRLEKSLGPGQDLESRRDPPTYQPTFSEGREGPRPDNATMRLEDNVVAPITLRRSPDGGATVRGMVPQGKMDRLESQQREQIRFDRAGRTDRAGNLSLGVSAHLKERIETAGLEIRAGDRRLPTEEEPLLQELARLLPELGDPGRQQALACGLTRFLADDKFQFVFINAMQYLYDRPGDEDFRTPDGYRRMLDDYRPEVTVRTMAGPSGPLCEITYRAPLPRPLDYREGSREEGYREGTAERPVLALTLRVPVDQLTAGQPKYTLGPPRLELGGG